MTLRKTHVSLLVNVNGYTSMVFHLSTKGDNIRDFMSASLQDKALPRGGVGGGGG